MVSPFDVAWNLLKALPEQSPNEKNLVGGDQNVAWAANEGWMPSGPATPSQIYQGSPQILAAAQKGGEGQTPQPQKDPQQMMDLNRRHAELNNSLQDYLAAGDFQGADAIRQQIETVNGEIIRMQSASQGE